MYRRLRDSAGIRRHCVDRLLVVQGFVSENLEDAAAYIAGLRRAEEL